jgi:curved DNA-binding protein CbpA
VSTIPPPGHFINKTKRTTMTLYQELGVLSTASQEELRHNYRIYAQKYHPDKEGGDEERFKRIKLAYEVLSDPIRRQEYDRTGKFSAEFTIRNEALERLSNMINHYVPDLNSEIDDPILKMKSDINQTTQTVIDQIETCKRHIRNSKITYEKLWIKSKGENILKNFVENLIKRRETDLSNLARQMIVFKLMLEILEDYHFGINDFELLETNLMDPNISSS